jgi:hypothetical protein
MRRGHKCSIVALGHKMLRTIFFMLKRNQHCRDSATDYEALSVQRNAPAGSKHWRNSALSPPSPDSACIVQQAAR